MKTGLGWSYYPVELNGTTKYKIKASFRVGSRSTSAICGYLQKNESLIQNVYNGDTNEFVKQEGNKIYLTRKENQKINHKFTKLEDSETDKINRFHSSQFYFRKIWKDLEIDKELDAIKESQKAKYKFNLNEVAFYLATKQVIESSSKLRAYNERSQYFFTPENLTLDSLYDSLDHLAKYADEINLKTYKKSLKYLEKKSKLYFYDVTSVNMSKTCEEDTLIGFKKGKEGIYGPIIQIGYLCDERGLLVGLIVFKGNKNEQASLKEQIEKIYGPSKVKDVVICTDAGLCSIKNKRFAEKKL